VERHLDRCAHLALDAELFLELAHEGVARVFPGLDFAARKLPSPREVGAGFPLGEQNPAVFDDDGGRYDDRSLPFARLV